MIVTLMLIFLVVYLLAGMQWRRLLNESSTAQSSDSLLLQRFNFSFYTSLAALAGMVVILSFMLFVNESDFKSSFSNAKSQLILFYAGNFFIKFSVIALLSIWFQTQYFFGNKNNQPAKLPIQKTGVLILSSVVMLTLGFTLQYFNGLTLSLFAITLISAFKLHRQNKVN